METKLELKNFKDENKKESNIDLALQKEKKQVLIENTLLDKLSYNFDYLNNYITKYRIKDKSKNIEDYRLTRNYSCDCLNNECNFDYKIANLEFPTKKNSNNNNEVNVNNCSCTNGDRVQLYECNSNCKCFISYNKGDANACLNRKIQNGIYYNFALKYFSDSKGFGLVYYNDNDNNYIKKGDFICEYIGEIISKDEAEMKIRNNLLSKKPNYILIVNESYETVNIKTCIDSELYGNMSRFINHSCEPNLYLEIIRTNYFIPQIAFFALKDIKAGEELTFCYNNTNFENEERKSNFSSSYKACECYSKNCLNFLPS